MMKITDIYDQMLHSHETGKPFTIETANRHLAHKLRAGLLQAAQQGHPLYAQLYGKVMISTRPNMVIISPKGVINATKLGLDTPVTIEGYTALPGDVLMYLKENPNFSTVLWEKFQGSKAAITFMQDDPDGLALSNIHVTFTYPTSTSLKATNNVEP